MKPAGSIRVVLADDAEEVRTEIGTMLHGDGRLRVVGSAADGTELLHLLARTACDVVLLDLMMPGKTGLEVLRELADRGSTVPVIVLSMHDEAVFVDRALALGAVGYVLKSAPKADVVRAIEAAVAGGAYLQSNLTKAVLERHLVLATTKRESKVDLSPRQVELLRGLAGGLSNKELSGRLGLSEETIKGYLKDLYARLGVTTRAGAAAAGIRRGFI